MIDAPNEQSRAASWDFARHNTPDAVLADERQFFEQSPAEHARDARRAQVLRERLLESERREAAAGELTPKRSALRQKMLVELARIIREAA